MVVQLPTHYKKQSDYADRKKNENPLGEFRCRNVRQETQSAPAHDPGEGLLPRMIK
jgi:hypothetical protein